MLVPFFLAMSNSYTYLVVRYTSAVSLTRHWCKLRLYLGIYNHASQDLQARMDLPSSWLGLVLL
jgi:hypothetical protein